MPSAGPAGCAQGQGRSAAERGWPSGAGQDAWPVFAGEGKERLALTSPGAAMLPPACPPTAGPLCGMGGNRGHRADAALQAAAASPGPPRACPSVRTGRAVRAASAGREWVTSQVRNGPSPEHGLRGGTGRGFCRALLAGLRVRAGAWRVGLLRAWGVGAAATRGSGS